jgi:hypothetical protein
MHTYIHIYIVINTYIHTYICIVQYKYMHIYSGVREGAEDDAFPPPPLFFLQPARGLRLPERSRRGGFDGLEEGATGTLCCSCVQDHQKGKCGGIFFMVL